TVAKKYMGTLGAMSKSMGFSEEQAYDMASAVTGLAGDVASFYNLNTDEAYNKLKSIWTGETESIKELGVVMTQTALDQYALNNGFGKTTAKMTEQEKVMLRYRYVMSSLSGAQGDFAKTSDSWANQTRILSLRFDSLKASLGQGFINLFTPILRCINLLLSKLNTLADGFKRFTEFLMGGSSDNTASQITGISNAAGEASSDISGMGDAAAGAAKKAQKALAGFDQITKIGSDSSESGAGSSAAGAAGMDFDFGSVSTDATVLDNVGGKISELVDDLKELGATFKDWGLGNFGDIFKTTYKDVLSQTNKFKNTMQKVWKDMSKLGKPFLDWFTGSFTKLLQSSLIFCGNRFTELLDIGNTVFADLWDIAVYPFLEKFVSQTLPALTGCFNELVINADILCTELKDIFDILWSESVAPALNSIMNIILDVQESLATFWNDYGQVISDKFQEAILRTSHVFKEIWEGTVKPIWDNICENVDWLWDKHLKPLWDNVVDFVGVLIECALQIYNQVILPIVNCLNAVLGPAFSAVFNFILDIVSTIIAAVIDVIDILVTTLKGVTKFLTGIFTADWEKAWEGIADIFKGIWEGIETVAHTIINFIIDILNGMISGFVAMINTVVRGINSIGFTMPDWLGGYSWSPGLQEFATPQIPKLAKGGIVQAPTLAMVGEAGKEAVMPLENNTGWIADLAQKIYSQGGSGEGNGSLESILREILNVLREIRNALNEDAAVIMGDEEIAMAVLKGIAKLKRKYGMAFEF
ncbi:MAG: hypothetical protein NC086_07805, partial [Alistipes sp.]|nr:hypothetical protein [Alistipes sp.]